MSRNDADDGAWFAPKRFGLGSSLPVAWQGWVFMAAHVGVVLAGILALRGHHQALVIWVLVTSLAPAPVYAARTRGGWRWRWGSGD
ncbi:MAG: hypothetical protein KGL48_01205 [Sphingomonadales bacterium]|nr:hypothetical protein [Sphingomonadales bacterium]MDE2567731.1 hypothetical protein [Sphingomonadales bacterium]